MYTCECQTKARINGEISTEQKPMEIPEDFYKRQAGYSNIKVFKCASQVFSSQGQKMNFGSYILLACFASFVMVIILYILKGRKALDKEFKDLEKIKERVPSNPPKDEKPVDQQKLDYDILVKKQQHPSNVQKDIVYTY